MKIEVVSLRRNITSIAFKYNGALYIADMDYRTGLWTFPSELLNMSEKSMLQDILSSIATTEATHEKRK